MPQKGPFAMIVRIALFGLAALLAFPGPRPAQANEGQVVAVVQRAVIRSDGKTFTLNEGQPVKLGDIVATGESGQAQIVFPDQTRIVVGPNSQVQITQLLFRNSNSIRRMSVSAVRGTFRFLSGSSPSRAYRLRTPTATMGVRGTAFDVAVGQDRSTDLVVFNGEVQICARGSRCARIPGGCQTVGVNRRGVFSQPATVGERTDRLRRFVLIPRQERLQAPFRTSTALCDDGGDTPTARVRPVRQVSLPPPPRSGGSGGQQRGPSERRGNPAE